MNFVDRVALSLHSGKGGDGMVHFKREKYRPHGGPDGGDGGRGGSIIIRTDPNLQTLSHLASLHHIKAEDGAPGQKDLKTGHSGQDVELLVPPGTVLNYGHNKQLDFAQITSLIFLKGGKGGKGNWHFRTATNQAPRHAEEGESGEGHEVIFQLKLIADVGLIGLPNAGKSSLLNALTRANSLVGSYPFTTLEPNLGVVKRGDWECVIADIPGLIEGAAAGRGLGHDFLAHVERTNLLLFCLPADSEDPIQDYRLLLNELGQYSESLSGKQSLLVITKADLLPVDKLQEISSRLKQQTGLKPVTTSSAANKGLVDLINEIEGSLTAVA